MDLLFKDKVILVAGSSKGLGFGIAQACHQDGAKVSLASRNQNEIAVAVEKLTSQNKSEVRGYQLDASDSDSIQNWISSSLKDFGRIDGLVVNAGGPPPGNFSSFDDQAWQEAFNLTLMSAVRMVRAVLPEMKKNQSGSILTITSSSIKEPIENLILSNVFRSGVVSLVKSLSLELAEFGIRVNNIVPGRIDTDRVRSLDLNSSKTSNETLEQQISKQKKSIPLQRYGTIEEFGSAGAFLLSERASYITGATLVVDGGKSRTVW